MLMGLINTLPYLYNTFAKYMFHMVNFPDDCILLYESPKTIFLIHRLYFFEQFRFTEKFNSEESSSSLLCSPPQGFKPLLLISCFCVVHLWYLNHYWYIIITLLLKYIVYIKVHSVLYSSVGFDKSTMWYICPYRIIQNSSGALKILLALSDFFFFF